ncbi:hypothetical protein CAAN1_10S02564 [[Candida] anglica]|uniref:Small ribosomal subunit protein mS38 n=1 Tax=[Candida] anglica TaxID=148631 RepID=A0ABP0EED8_9ASCO
MFRTLVSKGMIPVRTFAPMYQRFMHTVPRTVSVLTTPISTWGYRSVNNVKPTIQSLIQPFAPVEQDLQMEEKEDNTIYTDSVLRKRRLKMKKHKLRKRRRAQRALMTRLGK